MFEFMKKWLDQKTVNGYISVELLSREIRKWPTSGRIMPLISNIQLCFKNGALTFIGCLYNHLIIPHYNGSNKEIIIANT